MSSSSLAHLTPAERKKRKPLSCDLCRSRRKRCDRKNPCAPCSLDGRECTYVEADRYRRKDQSRPSSLRLKLDVQDWETRLEALIRQDGLAQAFVPFWVEELDFMYDAIIDTRLHQDVIQGTLDLHANSFYVPLLASLIALACQIRPDETQARLAQYVDGGKELDILQQTCHRYATNKADQYLDAYDRQDGPLRLEYLQTSLQCVSYVKNCGKITQVRNRLARDLSCMQIAHIHLLDHHARGGCLYVDAMDRHMARRLFWSYFQYDCFYIMLCDVGITLLNAKQCDVWLCTSTGQLIHIRQMGIIDTMGTFLRRSSRAHEGRTGGPRDGIPVVVTLDEIRTAGQPGFGTISPLSPFSSAMVQAAAIGGLLTGMIADALLDAARQNGMAFEAMQEQLARYQSETTLLNNSLEFIYNHNDLGRPGLSPTLKAKERAQKHVLAVTVSKLRFDAAIALANSLPTFVIDSAWVKQREETLAARLLERALRSPDFIPVGSQAWAFFLFYLYQPTKILLQRRIENVEGSSSSETSVDRLIHSGRLLLHSIARQSGSPLAQTLAKDIDVLSKTHEAMQQRISTMLTTTPSHVLLAAASMNNADAIMPSPAASSTKNFASIPHSPSHSSVQAAPHSVPAGFLDAELSDLIERHKDIFDSFSLFDPHV